MATRKKLDALLVQARRIAAHREAGAEREIRRVYRELLKGLLGYIAELHARFADGDGRLDYAALQKAGYEARYIEEIERRIGIASREVAVQVDALIKETYKLAYDSMVQGVMAQGKAPITERFAQSIAITPEQIAKAVNNPIMDLALEKNHRDIMYEIKQAVAVGLMNGDRYASVARRISEHLSADRGAYKRAVRIARTEAHRVREAGNNDAALRVDEELKAGDSGLRMVKTWRTMKDERVRPQRRRKGKGGWTTRMGKGANHMRLDGQTVLADENFDLKDGHTAPAPGMSGIAGHDINCRCIVVREVMDDAEFFAKTGRHLPGEVAEPLENAGKNGIMDVLNQEAFDKLSENLIERSSEVDRILSSLSYSSRGSKWSGTTVIKQPTEMPYAMGAKEWSCDISLRSDSSIKTAVHEHLHARSCSYYTPDVYIKWQRAEEGAVELYAQEICKKFGVAYGKAYEPVVKQLRIANSIMKEFGSEYEFARAFFEVGLPNRYAWLRSKADSLIAEGVLSAKSITVLNAAVDSIFGKV